MAQALVVVCGNAGTGKTTWAKQLARRDHAALLDLDTVSSRLVAAAHAELGRDPNDRDSPDYRRVFREAIYETLLAIARECEGKVVLVAPLTSERTRPDFPSWIAERAGCTPEIHYFVTDERVREERLRARQNPRDAAKFQDYAAYRELSPREAPPPYPHRWFDTTTTFPSLELGSRA
jgi:predicted kinase